MISLILALFSLSPNNALATETLTLSEKDFVSMVDINSPAFAQIQSRVNGTEAALAQAREAFTTQIYSSGSYYKTNEQALISFAPVFSPVKSLKVGIKKKTPFGVSADFSSGVESTTASSVGLDRATTLVHSFKLNFDLWKDFLGRTSRAILDNAEANREKNLLESKIKERELKNAVRKFYWQWVAYEESLKLNQALLESSKRQAQTARRRLANSIADRSEVARYEAQVLDRQASLTYRNYQIDKIKTEIKKILPSLNDKELKLAPYSIEKTNQIINNCTSKLMSRTETPFENTLYDEIAQWTSAAQISREQSLKRYSDPDLNITTEIKTTGVHSGNPGSISGAFSDLRNNNRWGYVVGVELRIPLGSSSSSAERFLREQNRLSLEAEKAEIKTRIINTHQLFLKSMRYLDSIIASQKENSKKLSIRVNEMRKKFSQARISVSEYINDQDSLFNSNLTVIDTQIQALGVLLDYFSIFTETQCEFNKF